MYIREREREKSSQVGSGVEAGKEEFYYEVERG